MSTKTAVVPFFKVTRYQGFRGHMVQYECRECGWCCNFNRYWSDRDERMRALASHLCDQHGTGPLTP